MAQEDTVQLTSDDLNRLLTILRTSSTPMTTAQLVDALRQAGQAASS